MKYAHVWGALIFQLGLSGMAMAETIGSCHNYFNQPEAIGTLGDDGSIIRNDPIAVIQNFTNVYTEPDAVSDVRQTVSFGDRVFLTNLKDGFYQVVSDTRLGDDAPSLGWIWGENLLCNQEPVMSEKTGIPQKFVIKTKASFADEREKTVTAKPGSDADFCGPDDTQCNELTRFTQYYVQAYDDARDKVLLTSDFLVKGSTPLVGWVSAVDGYIWETRHAIRPKEDLRAEDASEGLSVGDERVACMFETIDAAIAGEACQTPILGGYRWFNYPLRIPILDRVEQGDRSFFRVAMPAAGIGSDASGDVLKQFGGLDAAISLLGDLRNLDVFFLIDGTQSMQPNIDAITGKGDGGGVLQAIQDGFANDFRFDGVQVRYGFRAYRDYYAGDAGMGEVFPLGTECSPSQEDLEAQNAEFLTEIQKISSETGTDSGITDSNHEENLILALGFAADDIAACADHVKLLFVIGDTGSDLAVLKDEGQNFTPENASQMLTQGFSRDLDPVIPFFIQVPRTHDESTLSGADLEAYDRAYRRFETQGTFYVNAVSDHFQQDLNLNQNVRIAEHFYSLDGTSIADARDDLVEFIFDRVALFGDQRPVNEVISELQGGQALVEIITGLQQEGTVPALRLAQIERRICEELGDACESRVFNSVAEGYIEDNSDVVQDVLFSSEEFRTWRSKLDALKNSNQVTATELSEMIVKMMVDGLRNSTGDIAPAEMDMSIADFLNLKHGLPTAEKSPLLNYSLADFVFQKASGGTDQPGLVEICELYRVARWLESHRALFDTIEASEIPVFSLDPVDSCDMRYPTPELTLKERERFPEETMSFRHVLSDNTVYWIPNSYLP